MAVLVALAEWGGAALRAMTVDHGLRPEAAAEAEMVAAYCARLGVPHDVLHWQEGWDGSWQSDARRPRSPLSG
jgi:tRNA(Ile)-lysidine synthase